MRSKAALNNLAANVIKFPLESKIGQELFGTILTIQGPFCQVFNALSSYFRVELKERNFHITRMQGGGSELLSEPFNVIEKTKNRNPFSEDASGKEKKSISIKKAEPFELTEEIGKDFTYALTKSSNHHGFNNDPAYETGWAIRSYFCCLTHG